MEVSLPLDKMSTEDKIRTMETIWDDLCKKAETLSSPQWHEDVLNNRRRAVENGEDEFVNWEKSKKNIRDNIS